MASCNSCGFEKGEGRYCPKCGAMAGSVAAGTPEQTSPSQPMQSAQPLGAYASPTIQQTAGTSRTAKGFGIALIASAALGILSTFLPWLSGNGESFNGWKLSDFMKEYELFSSGPILVAVTGVVIVVVAIALLSAASKNSSMNRVGLGLGLIIPGLVMAGGLGATYNDLGDEYGKDAVSEILGAGWYVGVFCGFGIALLGILAFFIKPLSNSK